MGGYGYRMNPIVFLGVVLACAGSSDTAGTDLRSPCADEARAVDVSSGPRLEGDGLAATLESASPVPPSAAVGNAWRVALDPMPTEAPSVELAMPDHGHGAPDGEAVLVDGVVEVTVDFTMPGYWEVRLETVDGSVVLPVCAEP